MKRTTSGFFIVLASFNIAIALIPPCVSGYGAISFMSEMKMRINEKDLGKELEKHIAKEAPLAKYEAFGAVAVNTLSSLMLIGGAVGIFMAFNWARWLSVAACALMIFGLLVHDVYQIFFYRPVLMSFIDIHFPARLPADEVAQGVIKWATTMSILAWSCTNPVIMLYLVVAGLCLSLLQGFRDGTEIGTAGSNAPRRKRDRDDEDDELPKKKRKREDDDEPDDQRPSKPKKKSRDEYEED